MSTTTVGPFSSLMSREGYGSHELTRPTSLILPGAPSDSETAASAVRNLSGRPLPAPFNRALTITFQQADLPPSGSSTNPLTADDPRTLLLQPPRGREPDRGVRPIDAITQTLAAVPAGQLEEVLGRMKGLIGTSPSEARHLLTAQPQLAYALFQSMLMMDLVDPAVIARMTNNPAAGGPPLAPAAAAAVGPYGGGGGAGYPGAPAPTAPVGAGPYAGASAGRFVPAPPAGPRGGGPPPPNGPSSSSSTYPPSSGPRPSQQPPLQQQQQQQQPPLLPSAPGGPAAVNPALAALPPDQQAMLAQVLGMTAGQIDALPEEQRRSVLLLRSQFGA